MFDDVMNLLALLSNFGGPDLIIILLIVLVLFGAKKLPELAKGMGQAVKEFQKAKDEFSDELHNAGNTPPAKTDVRQADATVPRIDNAPTAREVPPAPRAEPAPSADERTSREV
ncbi:MAG: Sec-independent protein translocase subunit TatA/TatB [Chthoniobacterales bacterium]